MKKLILLTACMSSLLVGIISAHSQTVFINEIHYDNSGADQGEAVELAGTTGIDLAGWELVLYNGSNDLEYETVSLTGVFADESGGYGFLSFSILGIQNGDPDGIALVNAADSVVQFLSYEGDFMALNGPASGLLSTDIGISESSSTPVGESLQLTGTGLFFEDFTWVQGTNTFDSLNLGQSIGHPSDTTGGDTTVIAPGVIDLWINEIHYDNASSDVNEGVELAGTAGADLSGYNLVLYNGNGEESYGTVALSGILANQQGGFGTRFFAVPALQNGDPDGIALVAPSNDVIQFLSYEGSFTAMGGPADGLVSEDLLVEESGSTAVGLSLQLQGTGNSYADFTWAAGVASTYNEVNDGQTLIPAVEVAFINEIHYDNASTDTGEAIEVAGTAGLDLAGWSLVLYNGDNGQAYDMTMLSGLLPDQQNGFGTLFFPIAGIQNGPPDGVALVNAADSVVQFLSYEGAFAAVDGPAAGRMSADIGVEETSATAVGQSLQLVGSGFIYADFTWADPINSTFGGINTGQVFGTGVDTTTTDSLVWIPIAAARAKNQGDSVIISGVLTATDHFAGPAFLQDSTGGIALYDAAVHGEGLFEIGDEIRVQGVLDAFGQMLQVTGLTAVTSLSAGNLVLPDTLTISELADHEGELITLANVTFAEGALFYPGSNYAISDGSDTTQLRIDAEVSSLIGQRIPTGVTNVTGVVGSYNGQLQLLPRFDADVPGAQEYSPGGVDISRDSTLEVVTWNMEFFGTTLPTFGPSDVALQLTNARTVIEALDADIIAVQEVSETAMLDMLIDSLSGYARVCSDVYSYSFNPDPNFPAQKLCFIYKTSTVSISEEKVLFEQFYNDARTGVTSDMGDYPTGSASSFWASGRLPYMVSAQVAIQGVTATIRLVNIHAKSGGGSLDVARKTYDVQVLKDSLETYYADDMVIILGDYNDDVDVSIGGGASSYEAFVQDTAAYDPVTEVLSAAGFRSYVFSDNMIDHIAITDELFDSYIDNSAYTLLPFQLVSNYANTTSDHLPVVSRFNLFDLVAPLSVTPLADVSLTKGYMEESVVLTPQASGGLLPYTYVWGDGSTEAVYELTPAYEDSVVRVMVSDASGQQVALSAAVTVRNVSCERGGRRCKVQGVELCNGRRTVCVDQHFVERFVRRGWTLGACDVWVSRSCSATNNPWSSTQKLQFDFSDALEVDIVVYDFMGTIVSTQTVSVPAGTSNHDVPLPYKGLFYTRVLGKDGSFTSSFVMMRRF